MRRIGPLAAAVVGAVALVATPALAAPTALKAVMTAEEEVPAPGPAGAKGTADFQADPEAGTLCYKIAMEGSDPATMGHIHEGPAGSAGPVKVDLKLKENGLEGCVPADGQILQAVIADPGNFYANIHTTQYPAGAIRGQLTAG